MKIYCFLAVLLPLFSPLSGDEIEDLVDVMGYLINPLMNQEINNANMLIRHSSKIIQKTRIFGELIESLLIENQTEKADVMTSAIKNGTDLMKTVARSQKYYFKSFPLPDVKSEIDEKIWNGITSLNDMLILVSEENFDIVPSQLQVIIDHCSNTNIPNQKVKVLTEMVKPCINATVNSEIYVVLSKFVRKVFNADPTEESKYTRSMFSKIYYYLSKNSAEEAARILKRFEDSQGFVAKSKDELLEAIEEFLEIEDDFLQSNCPLELALAKNGFRSEGLTKLVGLFMKEVAVLAYQTGLCANLSNPFDIDGASAYVENFNAAVLNLSAILTTAPERILNSTWPTVEMEVITAVINNIDKAEMRTTNASFSNALNYVQLDVAAYGNPLYSRQYVMIEPHSETQSSHSWCLEQMCQELAHPQFHLIVIRQYYGNQSILARDATLGEYFDEVRPLLQKVLQEGASSKQILDLPAEMRKVGIDFTQLLRHQGIIILRSARKEKCVIESVFRPQEVGVRAEFLTLQYYEQAAACFNWIILFV